jgi:NADP-dependent 3-hydroxy acid dehydrogenase YdfG
MKEVTVEGKVAFVTGANRGIGKATTVELLEKGVKKVYAGVRDTSSLSELVDKYGERLVPVELDVTSDESITAAAAVATDVEILINNAGVIPMGNFLGGKLEETLKTNLDVNLWGVVKVTNAFLPTMKDLDSAAIVSVSSMAGLANMPMMMTYSASKAAVHSVIQGLRAELKDSNVLVSGVYPGPIATDMTKGFDMEMETPENVAKAVVQGIEDGVEDIFPDPMSKQMGAAYMTSPKEVETQFANFG